MRDARACVYIHPALSLCAEGCFSNGWGEEWCFFLIFSRCVTVGEQEDWSGRLVSATRSGFWGVRGRGARGWGKVRGRQLWYWCRQTQLFTKTTAERQSAYAIGIVGVLEIDDEKR